jgi:hypothetical protein
MPVLPCRKDALVDRDHGIRGLDDRVSGLTGSEVECLDGLVGDRGGNDGTSASIDPDMRRCGHLCHLEDGAFEVIRALIFIVFSIGLKLQTPGVRHTMRPSNASSDERANGLFAKEDALLAQATYTIGAAGSRLIEPFYHARRLYRA